MSRKEYKVYGSDYTVLRLPSWAEQVYRDLDPLVIREYEYRNDYYNEITDCYEVIRTYRYDLVGCIERHDLSDEQVEEVFYDLWKELHGRQ